ncbi:MAG TPA: NADH-quinone oxidoreductase subunit A [Candidatus Thermoplasmatota archaeon]|nr:NADH-quinone oxidoreductase subunit A [Candidatus Thermoplasmatota archaeon]
MDVLADYAPIAILLVLAFVMIWATLALTRIIGPLRRTPGKLSTYESGEVPKGSARGPVDVQYYIYVLVFLVLDIEAVFLIPWALNVTELGAFGLVEMAIFVGLLILGWAYAWKKGALAWQA